MTLFDFNKSFYRQILNLNDNTFTPQGAVAMAKVKFVLFSFHLHSL